MIENVIQNNYWNNTIIILSSIKKEDQLIYIFRLDSGLNTIFIFNPNVQKLYGC